MTLLSSWGRLNSTTVGPCCSSEDLGSSGETLRALGSDMAWGTNGRGRLRLFLLTTMGPRDLKMFMKGLPCGLMLTGGWEGLLTGLLKIGMGASDLGLGGGGDVPATSNWKPQPD